jgi:hypothetical protein
MRDERTDREVVYGAQRGRPGVVRFRYPFNARLTTMLLRQHRLRVW